MKLLTPTEAATMIGCSRGHIYALVAAGKLTRHFIGVDGKSTTRVSDEDVERFIRESATPLPGDAA